jgi:hypothetical protein
MQAFDEIMRANDEQPAMPEGEFWQRAYAVFSLRFSASAEVFSLTVRRRRA